MFEAASVGNSLHESKQRTSTGAGRNREPALCERDLAPLFASGETHEIMALYPPPREGAPKPIKSLRTADLDTALAFVAEAERAGALGTYAGFNPVTMASGGPDHSRPSANHAAALTALFLDFDTETAKTEGRPAITEERQRARAAGMRGLETLQRYGHSGRAARYGTSGNGYYVIVPLEPLENTRENRALVAAALDTIAAEINGAFPGIVLDTGAGKRANGVRRISGTTNRNNGGDAQCILAVHPGDPIPRAMLEAIAADAPTRQRPTDTAPSGPRPAGDATLSAEAAAAIIEACRKYRKQGNRHNTGLDIPGWLAWRGISREAARSVFEQIIANDNDQRDRLAAFERTYDRFEAGEDVAYKRMPRELLRELWRAIEPATGDLFHEETPAPNDAKPEPESPSASDDHPGLRARLAVVTAERDAARRALTQARRDISALTELLLNPYLPASQKTAATAAMVTARRKTPDADGNVVAKPGEISNDWRPKPKPGDPSEPLNRDGSKYRMARGTVKSTMKTLCEYGLEAEPVSVMVELPGREPYPETGWKMKRPQTIAGFLAPIATYEPETIPTRQGRPRKCRECGEFHTMTVRTTTRYTCHGCGSTWEEEGKPRTIAPVVDLYPDAKTDETDPGDKISPVRETPEQEPAATADTTAPQEPGDKISPVYTQHAYTGDKISPPPSSAPLFAADDAPEPSEPEPDSEADYQPRRCKGCRAILAAGEPDLCPDCAAHFAERERKQAERHRERMRDGLILGRKRCAARSDCSEYALPGSLYCREHGGHARDTDRAAS